MSKHDKFILAPMSKILREVVLASAGIGSGIETYPLCDYIMQSVFLKMTGYQEQKMKCIAWEIATNNFDYRRRLLNNEDKLGECSTYESKNKVYKSLCRQIELNSDVFTDIDMKKRVRYHSYNYVKDIFKNTNLEFWNYKSFKQFLGNDIIKDTQYLNKNGNLFENQIINEYSALYNERNRIAHNTLSYQQNLPDFNVLRYEGKYSRNYFLWFAILLLIDNIFMEIYKVYENNLKYFL